MSGACLAGRVAVVLLALAACSAPPATPTAPDRPRATPYADGPVAGICGEATGAEVVMRLEPGIPDPRCVRVTPSQVLRVVNRTGSAVTVTLGEETYSLEADGEVVFATRLGEALLPGVHVLIVDPCCGGELWLTE